MLSNTIFGLLGLAVAAVAAYLKPELETLALAISVVYVVIYLLELKEWLNGRTTNQ